jgi:vesicle-fusing ATPase
VLLGGLPVVEVAGAEAVVGALLEELESPLVVLVGESKARAEGRVELHRSVELPAPSEARELWASALGEPVARALAGAVEEVAQHFRLGAAAIEAIARELEATATAELDPAAELRRLCRERSRVRLEGLAERIDPKATWDDLVLPPGQGALLRELVRHVRHRTQVYERWGFGERTTRGLGVTALFSGEAGTGKTLAAEVLARELGLDLYRIDLAATVSKYIGETEKNLARLFDAAEASGAVLLFDEADALFGKRGEVRDGHDRYANLEVAYLLQRMESYRGLAILTTNLRSNVDRAFLRRLRFVVQFPFPAAEQRAEIWRRTFPPAVPLDGLEPERLARLVASGGSIRSIALSAAFAAAEDGGVVTAGHVLRAARVEYAKAERPLTDAETRGLA